MSDNQLDSYQLLCLPFAGGNEFCYQKFDSCLPGNIQMVTFDLPGKGKRIKEKPLRNIHQIVEEIGNQCLNQLDKPYAIYGHSMGALLGHLLVHWLKDHNMPAAEQLFFTSYYAPSHHHDKNREKLSDKEFIEHLSSLNGIPPALLQEKKLLDIFLPILRADIEAIDGYVYEAHEPYNIPITVVAGSLEKGLNGSLRDWNKETKSGVNFYRFEGDHFFIFQEAQRLCSLINATLGQLYAFEP